MPNDPQALPTSLMILEAANIFCEHPSLKGGSNHLVVADVKLPALEEAYVDHRAGGANVAIEIPTVLNRLESTFVLVGFQRLVMNMIGLSREVNQKFTILGLLRNRQTGEAVQMRAILTGKMGRVNPTNYRRGEVMHHEYAIRGITGYWLSSADDPTPIYDWDFFTNRCIIGGVDANADLNSLLGITAITAESLVTAP